MVLSGAESIDPTRIFNQASNLAHVVLTEFVIWAVVIVFTFYVLAPNFVIARISMVASLTWANCFVITGCAFCITSTEYWAITSILTLGLTQGIFNAFFSFAAVGIRVTSNFSHTDAILAELEVWTAVVWFASWLADSLDTKLVYNTFTCTCALSWKKNMTIVILRKLKCKNLRKHVML